MKHRPITFDEQLVLRRLREYTRLRVELERTRGPGRAVLTGLEERAQRILLADHAALLRMLRARPPVVGEVRAMREEDGGSCDWGHCNEPGVVMRFSGKRHGWLPVCAACAVRVGRPR